MSPRTRFRAVRSSLVLSADAIGRKVLAKRGYSRTRRRGIAEWPSVTRVVMLTTTKTPRTGQNIERRKLFAEMKRVAADGEWHDPATIAKLIGANADDVEKMFLRIRRDG